MIHEGLTDAFHDIHMGITAENLVERYRITPRGAGRLRRREPGPGARPPSARAASRRRSCAVPVPQKKGEAKPFDTDEHPRAGHHRGVARQAEARLQEGRDGDRGQRERPQRRRGGAGGDHARRAPRGLGVKPLARIVSYASAGGGPEGDGHRPRARGAQGAGEGGPVRRPHRPVRAERGLRRPEPGRAARAGARRRHAST